MFRKVFLMFLSVLGLIAGEPNQVLTPSQFEQKMQEVQGKLLDVRTPDEYNSGHLSGALNLDFFSESFKNELAKLPKDQVYYVYCKSGGRSGKTRKLLNDAGFTQVFDLEGGITRWISEGKAVEK